MTNAIVHWVLSGGYVAIFLAMVLESACIPLPSEVIMPFGGYLASVGHFNFWGVVAAGVFGNVCGALITYLIGYSVARPLILRYGRKIRAVDRYLTQAEAWFAKRGDVSVLIGRVIPIVRTFISLPAGIAKMPAWRFFLYTTMGSVPWVYVLTWSGADLARSWRNVDRFVNVFTYVVAAAIVLMLATYVTDRLRKKDKSHSHRD